MFRLDEFGVKAIGHPYPHAPIFGCKSPEVNHVHGTQAMRPFLTLGGFGRSSHFEVCPTQQRRSVECLGNIP